jgi:phosphohistidine phosphatase
MKQLVLIRHGDAPKNHSMMDFDRELSDLGKSQAALSAKHLEKYNIGHILCSPTPRTRQTLEVLNQNLALKKEVIDFAPSIYENCHDTLSRLVDIQSNNEETMLIVGHNPSLLQLALFYDTDADEKWHDEISLGLKPAEIIVINFKKAEFWGQTCHAGGEIVDIFIPNPK